jgi:hypothetical protein
MFLLMPTGGFPLVVIAWSHLSGSLKKAHFLRCAFSGSLKSVFVVRVRVRSEFSITFFTDTDTRIRLATKPF